MKKKTNKPSKAASATLQTNADFKTALIVVSVTLNLVVFITWLVAQVSEDYAKQLASLL
jgi:hypothetical protein